MMQQLGLFENQKRVLPTFDAASYIAHAIGIRPTKQDRKDVEAFTDRILSQLEPEVRRFQKMTKKHGPDEYISLKLVCFWDCYSPDSGRSREDRRKPWKFHC